MKKPQAQSRPRGSATRNPKGSSGRGVASFVLVVVVVSLLVTVGLCGFMQLIYRDIPGPVLEEMPTPDGVVGISSSNCAACHEEIHREWQHTNHGRATTDPLYVADRTLQNDPWFCDNCHAPVAEQRHVVAVGLLTVWPDLIPIAWDNPSHEPALRHEGVMCVACHLRNGAMHGPLAAEGAPHATVQTDALKQPSACAPCHGLDFALIGNFVRPLQDTMAEHQRYRDQGGARVCIDCHMPEVGPRVVATGGKPRPSRSHKLLGPFDEEFVRTGLSIVKPAITVTEKELSGTVRLENLAGHNLPTAEPHRWFAVELVARDGSGRIIARDNHLIKRRVDLEALTEEPGTDTTLKPHEVRDVTLRVSAVEAESADLTVRFHLWDPADPVAVKAGISGEDLVFVLHRTRWSQQL